MMGAREEALGDDAARDAALKGRRGVLVARTQVSGRGCWVRGRQATRLQV